MLECSAEAVQTMMNKAVRGVAVFLGIASMAICAQAEVVPCIGPGVNSPVGVPAANATSAGIFFRSQGTPAWYSVELKPEAGGFYGVLPRPEEGTVVEYQIETTDAAGKKVRTDTTRLAASSCKPTLTPEQKTMASNLVIGKPTDDAPDFPPGFSCTGIIGDLSPSGGLKPTVCNRKKPVPVALYAVGGVVLAGGGYALYRHYASASKP